PLGVQYSLIGFTVFLINKINYKNKKALYNHFLLLFIVLLFSASIWVSDLAVVSITLLLIVLLVFQFFEEKKLRFNYQLLPYIIGGIFINYLFIKYAKSHATAITKNYTSFNDINSFLQGIDIVKTEIIKT